MKRPKLNLFLILLAIWALSYLGWVWWNSFPKVRQVVIAPESSISGKIDSLLQQAINEYRLPGISLALVKKGKVIYLNAFGLQNLESKTPLDVNSTIPVASVSKLFTSLAVSNTAISKDMKATDLLENSVQSRFPKLNFIQLLEHRSGLKTRRTIRSTLFRNPKLTLEEWGEAYLENGKFQTPQDTSVAYSDLNSDLLGFWLTKQLEGNFQEEVNKRIFEPAGMDHSSFLDENMLDSLPISGYQHTILWKRLETNQLKLPVFPSPSSGLLTSTKDMSLALIHLLRGEMGNFEEELKWLDDPENAKLLGFQKIMIQDSNWIGHFGGQNGYSSFFFFSKNQDTGIFLFFNLKDPEDYRLELSKKILSLVSK